MSSTAAHAPLEPPEHYRYENRILWTEKRRGVVQAPELTPLVVAPPAEFGGEGAIWNPEELLLAAANACLMTTFIAIAAKARVAWSGYSSRAVAHLTSPSRGLYAITSVELAPVVDVPDGAMAERAARAMRSAERHCLISNSLKYPTLVRAEFRVVPPSGQPPVG